MCTRPPGYNAKRGDGQQLNAAPIPMTQINVLCIHKDTNDVCHRLQCKCNSSKGCGGEYGIPYLTCPCGADVPLMVPLNGFFYCRSCKRQFKAEELNI